MIKFKIKQYVIIKEFLTWNVFFGDEWIDDFLTSDDAILYCMEN